VRTRAWTPKSSGGGDAPIWHPDCLIIRAADRLACHLTELVLPQRGWDHRVAWVFVKLMQPEEQTIV
jgi:hypothetical protein